MPSRRRSRRKHRRFGHTAADLAVRLSFAMKHDGAALTYAVDLLSPQTVSMTLSFGFQSIGNLGVPIDFNPPLGRVATGEVPLSLGQTGRAVLPDRSVKTYAITLKPMAFAANRNGLSAAWKGGIVVE